MRKCMARPSEKYGLTTCVSIFYSSIVDSATTNNQTYLPWGHDEYCIVKVMNLIDGGTADAV